MGKDNDKRASAVAALQAVIRGELDRAKFNEQVEKDRSAKEIQSMIRGNQARDDHQARSSQSGGAPVSATLTSEFNTDPVTKEDFAWLGFFLLCYYTFEGLLFAGLLQAHLDAKRAAGSSDLDLGNEDLYVYLGLFLGAVLLIMVPCTYVHAYKNADKNVDRFGNKIETEGVEMTRV